MRYLGLDLGTKTLGISISDVNGIIASSLKTLRFENENYKSLLDPIKEIVEEMKVCKVVLGFPKNMNNTIGKSAERVLKFKENLEKHLNVEVVLQDERLSSVEANYYLLSTDMSRKKRKSIVDSIADNIILQTYLDKKVEGKNE